VELDKTTIVIRERSYVDILDLALRVFRAHAGPLAAALAAGIVPMLLLNAWLLSGYAEADFDAGFPMRYMFYSLVLITWEMPLAAAPATAYLGEALFSRQPEMGKIVGNLRQALPQLLLYQVLLRGFLVPAVLWGATPIAVLAAIALAALWTFLFVWRAYLNEVILLERNPLRGSGSDAMTTRRRTKVLHGGQAGDLLGRWLGAAGVGGLLFACLWGSMWFLRAMLLTEFTWDDSMCTWYYQLALWIVAAFFGVVRFLSYLDLRIRREGWEVELGMRAEQARMLRQLT
jgi:hypothetical protein